MSAITKESSTSTYKLENNLMIVRVKMDAEITLDATKEGVRIRKEMQNGKKILLCIDMREVGHVDKEAREYASKKEFENMNTAVALLTGKSLAATIIGNFFIKFNKPNTPTKIFKSEEKAKLWLASFS